MSKKIDLDEKQVIKTAQNSLSKILTLLKAKKFNPQEQW